MKYTNELETLTIRITSDKKILLNNLANKYNSNLSLFLRCIISNWLNKNDDALNDIIENNISTQNEIFKKNKKKNSLENEVITVRLKPCDKLLIDELRTKFNNTSISLLNSIINNWLKENEKIICL